MTDSLKYIAATTQFMKLLCFVRAIWNMKVRSHQMLSNLKGQEVPHSTLFWCEHKLLNKNLNWWKEATTSRVFIA